MKRLRDILEGEVIQFKPKPKQPLYTQDSVQELLQPILQNNLGTWHHKDLRTDPTEHSVESIHKAINFPRATGLEDNHLVAQRRNLAKQHYLTHRQAIDNHVNDTLGHLEGLSHKVLAGNFSSEKEKTFAIKDIELARSKWSRIRTTFKNIVSND